MNQPLQGRRILLTRAQAQSGGLADRLRAAGAEVWEFPVIAIADPDSWAPLDAAVGRLEQYRWVVLTSANGAERFVARLRAAGVRLAGRPAIAAVGSATARVLGELGLPVDVVPPQFRGAALPGALGPHLQPGDRILLPRGDLADPELPQALRGLGAQVDEVLAYRTVPATPGDTPQLLAALREGQIDYITFTSGSTVQNLLAITGPDVLAWARIACIGPETAKVARSAGLQVQVVAPAATTEGLVEALVEDGAR